MRPATHHDRQGRSTRPRNELIERSTPAAVSASHPGLHVPSITSFGRRAQVMSVVFRPPRISRPRRGRRVWTNSRCPSEPSSTKAPALLAKAQADRRADSRPAAGQFRSQVTSLATSSSPTASITPWRVCPRHISILHAAGFKCLPPRPATSRRRLSHKAIEMGIDVIQNRLPTSPLPIE